MREVFDLEGGILRIREEIWLVSVVFGIVSFVYFGEKIFSWGNNKSFIDGFDDLWLGEIYLIFFWNMGECSFLECFILIWSSFMVWRDTEIFFVLV